MTALRTLVALSVATLAAGSAFMRPGLAQAAAPGMTTTGAYLPVAVAEPRMKAMQDMHRKMMEARTPAERQALMADHTKAMQDGMTMMKEQHAMHAGMGGMGGMGEGKAMPAEMAKRHQMMSSHMATMQMMMDMMSDQMPPAQVVR
jgi:hypothetical protein